MFQTSVASKVPTLTAFFWSFIVKHKWKFSGLMATATIYSFAQSYMPYLVGEIIDAIVAYKGDPFDIYSVLAVPLILFTIIRLASSACTRLEDLLQAYTLPQVRTEIRAELFNLVQRHSYPFFQENMSGNIAKKIIDLSDNFENIFSSIHDTVYTSMLTFVFSTYLLWSRAPVFAYLVMAWFLVVLTITGIMSARSITYSRQQAEASSAAIGNIIDSFRNILTVKMFTRQNYEARYLDKFQKVEVDKTIELEWATMKIHIFRSLATTVLIVGTIFLLIYGWQRGWVSIGDFSFVTSTSFTISHTVWWLSKQLVWLYREIGTAKQAFSIVETPIVIDDTNNTLPSLIVSDGRIEFQNVSFYYSPDNQIFHGKSIVINGKERIGLVGFSGSGKTTFINLILRFYDPSAGKILIDHQNIRNFSVASLREHISVIPQDPGLFHRTILANISYGKLDATEQEIIEAAKLAHCHEFIEQMPNGYHTMIGENGSKLSAGQRQRISIARAILKNAPILILDEATAALDSITEQQIQTSIEYLMQNRTAIVIAHRLSTLINMDRILVFKNGQIVEDGSPEELLRLNGHYAKLWNMQAGGFLPHDQEQ